MSDVYDIHQFDFAKKVRLEQTILIVGRRGSGKTFLLKRAVYEVRHMYDMVILFTPTYDTVKDFRDIIPEPFIFGDGADVGTLARLLAMGNALSERGKEVHILVIADDASWDKDFFKTDEVRQCYYNGRHAHVTLWITAQDLTDTKLKLREQCDYVFVMQDANCKNVKRFHDHFFNMFDSAAQFMVVYNEATATHGALVLDNTNKDKQTIENSVFWYRAPATLPEFRTCATVFWTCTQLAKLLQPLEEEKKRRAEAEEKAGSRARKASCTVRMLKDADEEEEGHIVDSSM